MWSARPSTQHRMQQGCDCVHINTKLTVLLEKLSIGRLLAVGGKAKNHIRRFGSATKSRVRRWKRQRNDLYKIEIHDLSVWDRLEGGFPATQTLLVNRSEWARVEEFNFGGPLGWAPASRSGIQPEEFCVGGSPTDPWRRNIRPQDICPNPSEVEAPPGYDWAAISSLPLPVKIESSGHQETSKERERQIWASVFAARREKAQLLALQEYITTRVAQIEKQTEAVIGPRMKEFPQLELQYHVFHSGALMRDANVPAPEPAQGCDATDHDTLHPAFFEPRQDLLKECMIRDRLSPLSIFRSGTAICS